MSALYSVCDVVFEWLWRTSWHVAALVLFVLLVQAISGRWLLPRWRYGLWLLVVGRLVLPAVPEVPLGAIDWNSASAPGPEARLETLSTSASIGSVRPRTRGEEAEPRSPDARPEEADRKTTQRSSVPSVLPVSASAVPDVPIETAPFPWRALVVLVWAAVATALLLRLVFAELAFRRGLRSAEIADDPELVRLFDECRRALGVTRHIELLHTDLVSSPAVFGVRRPRLLLPRAVVERFRADDLRHVFLHEIAHLRRGDVLLAGVVGALGQVFWFHPLVRLAIARLRAAQESARDWEALAAFPSPAPIQYASTLLKLLECPRPLPGPARAVGFLTGGRDLKRRIMLIAEFRAPSRRAKVVGGALLAAVAWATYTSAGVEAPIPTPPSDGGAQKLQEVSVERHRAAPAWKRELDQALDNRVVVDFSGPVSELLATLRAMTGINIVEQPGFLDDYGDPEIELRLPDTTLRAALDLLSETVDDMGWCLARQAVYVGEEGSLPEALGLRFYKLEPLLRNDPHDDAHERADRIIDLVQTFAHHRGRWNWEDGGVSIDYWNGLLVVTQTDAMHAEVEAFLNRLLNRGAEPERPAPGWRAELEKALATPTEVQADYAAVEDVVAALSERHGLPILVGEDYEGYEVTLHLGGVPLATALEWVADILGARVRVEAGAVLIGDRGGPPTLEFYELGDLYRDHDADVDVRGHLSDMMRNFIDPESWDYEPVYCIEFWDDLMLVNQSEAAHAEVADLVDAVKRALR